LLITVFIISFHVITGVILAKGWADPVFVEEKLDLPEKSNLISFLREKGLNRGYMHYWLSYPVVFLTDEDIIMTPAYDERFGRYRPPYLAEAESSEKVCFIFHPASGLSADWFRGRIKKSGGGFMEESIDKFTVFYGFRAPFKANLKKISGPGLKFSASHNSEKLMALRDSDEASRWGSASPQRPGMFVEAELPGPRRVAGVDMSFGKWGHDYPRGVEVLVRPNGGDWVKVCSVPELGGSIYWDELLNPRIFVSGESYRILFAPVRAEAVKIVQTGSHEIFDWSMAELGILEAEDASPRSGSEPGD
jgi:hypothetical protein